LLWSKTVQVITARHKRKYTEHSARVRGLIYRNIVFCEHKITLI
jgi:hypothetical protein